MAKKSVDPETLPYRPCVGIMVLNPAGLVWAGHRIAEPDGEMAGSSKLWQMPQGGIDKGEEPFPAALRELYEETGMRSVSLIAEAPGWLTYDLPRDLVGLAFKGRYRGQTQKWYALRFEGDESEIAIDDFGSGYSNMSYLGKIPARYLKIDQAFVRPLDQERNNQLLVRAIIEMAHALGYEVVAEGIETQQAFDLLASWNCDEGQGYLMSRPLANDQLAEWLAAAPRA